MVSSGSLFFLFCYLLVLCGETYHEQFVKTATSKFHDFTNVETAGESFGFRGEALASISDISLLEVRTKAIGRPNGYRKVMKVWDDFDATQHSYIVCLSLVMGLNF